MLLKQDHDSTRYFLSLTLFSQHHWRGQKCGLASWQLVGGGVGEKEAMTWKNAQTDGLFLFFFTKDPTPEQVQGEVERGDH